MSTGAMFKYRKLTFIRPPLITSATPTQTKMQLQGQMMFSRDSYANVCTVTTTQACAFGVVFQDRGEARLHLVPFSLGLVLVLSMFTSEMDTDINSSEAQKTREFSLFLRFC